MSDAQDERLQNELSLLEAMYVDQIAFDQYSRELKYANESGTFVLRVPDGYLRDQLPEVLSARIGKDDRREQLRQQVNSLAIGEEVLDTVITAFNDCVDEQRSAASEAPVEAAPSITQAAKATVVVWLHHLLNTNKRKQALSPASSEVSGVTKPGYPGVLIYTGPAVAVHEHVNELKALNWQAFQIRLESQDEWPLSNEHGVREVESMKEVVATVGSAHKEDFMEAMRMK